MIWGIEMRNTIVRVFVAVALLFVVSCTAQVDPPSIPVPGTDVDAGLTFPSTGDAGHDGDLGGDTAATNRPEYCQPVEVTPIELTTSDIGPHSSSVPSIHVDPGNLRRVYANAYDSLFRSEDGGLTWGTLEFDVSHNMIGPLAIDPNDSANLFVVLLDYGTHSLHRSTDDGLSWTELPSEFTRQIHSLAVDPFDSARLWLGTHGNGVYQSTDSGETWSPTGLTEGIVDDLLADPTEPDRLYASGNMGVWASVDGGETWTSEESAGTHIRRLAMDPFATASIYAIVHEGGGSPDELMRSTDGGMSWNSIYDGQNGDLRLNAVLVDPCDSERIWIGARGGVQRSDDGGETWQLFDGFPARGGIVIYSLGWVQGRLLAGTEMCGLHESLDNGETWRHVADQFCENLPTAN